MTIWIDAKNAALYSSGINFWLHDLLEDLNPEISVKLVLAVPDIKQHTVFSDLKIPNLRIPWPRRFPRQLAHFLFDNYLFMRSATYYKPDLIISPYFDVLMPKEIPSVITIHDLCFLEAASSYSFLRRTYFISQMKRNSRRASKILTVSETSKKALIKELGLAPESILIIENRLQREFLEYRPSDEKLMQFKNQFILGSPILLYTSGLENRKNVPNLLTAVKSLAKKHTKIKLIVTGEKDLRWSKILKNESQLKDIILFTGYLSQKDLKTAYLAADVVVAPSLSEGFGRSCLEALTSGRPLACSDIAIFREIAGKNAIFFDPHSPDSIASAIETALKKTPETFIPEDFSIREQQITELREFLLSLGVS